MFLKNYTSDVPVSQTIARIETVLLRAGVSTIAKEYGPNQQTVAVTFSIAASADKPMLSVRMPADVAAAQNALWLDYVDGEKLSSDGNSVWYNARKKKTRKDFLEQGERTAWKLVQDWIEVQISMIQLHQADVVQVFLPYIWDGRNTFYQRLKNSDFKALMPPKEESKLEVVS